MILVVDLGLDTALIEEITQIPLWKVDLYIQELKVFWSGTN